MESRPSPLGLCSPRDTPTASFIHSFIHPCRGHTLISKLSEHLPGAGEGAGKAGEQEWAWSSLPGCPSMGKAGPE